MDRRSFLFCVPLLLGLGVATFAKEKDKKEKPEKKAKPEVYCVLQVGKEEFEPVAQKDLKKKKADMAKDYKEEVKAWNQAKKEAKKAKQKFTDPKPKPKMFKIVAKGLKGEEAAQKRIADILEAIRKAKEKKEKGGGDKKKKK